MAEWGENPDDELGDVVDWLQGGVLNLGTIDATMMDVSTRGSDVGIPTRQDGRSRIPVSVGEEGTHRMAMSCQPSLCLRWVKVYVDTWVSQVSQMLQEGVIYCHSVLIVPARLWKTFDRHAAGGRAPSYGVESSAWMISLAGSVARLLRGLQRRDPDAWLPWAVQSASAYHGDQWRMGFRDLAVAPSQLFALSHVAVHPARMSLARDGASPPRAAIRTDRPNIP